MTKYLSMKCFLEKGLLAAVFFWFFPAVCAADLLMPSLEPMAVLAAMHGRGGDILLNVAVVSGLLLALLARRQYGLSGRKADAAMGASFFWPFAHLAFTSSPGFSGDEGYFIFLRCAFAGTVSLLAVTALILLRRRRSDAGGQGGF